MGKGFRFTLAHTVDDQSNEGDLRAGLMMALATSTARAPEPTFRRPLVGGRRGRIR
jgi:hypothetical protein